MQIETARLILRPFEAGDTEAFVALNADRNVMRYYPHAYTRDFSLECLGNYAARWRDDGFGFAAVIEKATGAFLGLNGLSYFRIALPFAPVVEIGWRFVPSAWGKGYASEAARAWLAFGFESKGLEEIVSFTAHQNTPSQKVMQRIGLRRHAAYDFDMPSLPDGHPLRPHLVYRTTHAQFMDEFR